MAQHYKNEGITLSRINVFTGWSAFNPKGNVAPGRMDQNLCGRLWTRRDRDAVQLSIAEEDEDGEGHRGSNNGSVLVDKHQQAMPVHEDGLRGGARQRRPAGGHTTTRRQQEQQQQPQPQEPWTRASLEARRFRPAALGIEVGPTFATRLFRVDVVVPQHLDGAHVHLLWDANCEALVLTPDGHPRQGLVGGDHWARRADYPLFPDRPGSVARAGDTARVYIEVACNGLFGAGRGGDIEPPDEEKYYKLEECCIAAFDPLAWALIHDVTLLAGCAKDMPVTSPRRAQALLTANQVVNVVDVNDRATYQAGRDVAATFLSGAPNAPTQTVVHSMLHSHIDLAWLWPMAATPGKGARTFATQLRLLEQYPDAIFVQSQAQLYDWVKQSYPALWKEVCVRVTEGRFVPVGATWVEMDCNIPSGESLVRQFVEGQGFFEENFGVRCKEFWLPDTFGYSAQLPQIMRGCGVEYFLTQKLSWNLFNKFPHSTFVWEGLDGTRVLAHMPPADTYNAQAFPDEVLRSAAKNKDIGILNASIMLVGHGDGGGGASPAMLESMARMRDVDGIPKVEFSTPSRFFECAREKQKELPRWVGELYFELHRGTYTSQANIKKMNRQCEALLRDAEMLCTHALVVGRTVGTRFEYPAAELKRCWRLVLLQSFHDTLPGSCIAEAYRESHRDFSEVVAVGDTIMKTAIIFIEKAISASDGRRASKRVKVSKGDGTQLQNVRDHAAGPRNVAIVSRGTGLGCARNARPYIIEWPHTDIDEAGNFISQKNMQNPGCPLVALASTPIGLGIDVHPHLLREEDMDMNNAFAPAYVNTTESENGIEFVLGNGIIKARISQSGRLKSLTLLSSTDGVPDREAVAEPKQGDPNSGEGNTLVLYDDVPQFWCAWDTEVYSFEKYQEIGPASEVKVFEHGPLRVQLLVEYPPTNAGSVIRQYISLRAESGRLDFLTEVDWRESRKLLRVMFNTQVRAPYASYDSQFGFVQRPTTFNHSWEIAKYEVVGHQYADLSEHNFGIALLNDCKYGYSVRDSVMRLSLLRASKSPDDSADMGHHRFTYAILPHWHAFPVRSVVEEAADLNWAPQARGVVGQGLSHSPGTLLRVLTGEGLDSVVISAVKRAERQDDAIVIRAYESLGGRGLCGLALSCEYARVKEVHACNMLEERVAGAIDVALRNGCEVWLPFMPFQIRTILIVLE